MEGKLQTKQQNKLTQNKPIEQASKTQNSLNKQPNQSTSGTKAPSQTVKNPIKATSNGNSTNNKLTKAPSQTIKNKSSIITTNKTTQISNTTKSTNRAKSQISKEPQSQKQIQNQATLKQTKKQLPQENVESERLSFKSKKTSSININVSKSTFVKQTQQLINSLVKQTNLKGDIQNLIKNNFKLITLETLGQGAFGSVDKVYDAFSDKYYALKTMVPESLSKNDLQILVDDTIHEININLNVLDLKSNNIATLAAFEVQDVNQNQLNCRILFEMGICTLDNLLQIIPSGSWNEKQLLFVLKETCLGLSELYTKNIIHMDIKPANIVLSGDLNNFKLIDLGIAHIVKLENDNINTLLPIQGTPQFMTPEMKKAMKNDDENLKVRPYTQDTYSLGKSILKLITGSISIKNLAEFQEKYSSKYPTLIPLILRMIDELPEQRILPQEIYQKLSKLQLDLDLTKQQIIQIKKLSLQKLIDKHFDKEDFKTLIDLSTIYRDKVNDLLLAQLFFDMVIDKIDNSKFKDQYWERKVIFLKSKSWNQRLNGQYQQSFDTLVIAKKIVEKYQSITKQQQAVQELLLALNEDLLTLNLQFKSDQTPQDLVNNNIQLQTQTHGTDSVDAATSYANSGLFNVNQGQFQEAISNLEKALNILNKQEHSENIEIKKAEILINIGICYGQMNNFDLSVTKQKEGVQIYSDIYGNNNMATAQAKFNLAVTMYNNNLTDEPIQILNEVLAIYQKKLPPGHQQIIKCQQILDQLK